MENKFQIYLSVIILGLLIFLVINKPTTSFGSAETITLSTFTHASTSIAATGKNTVLAANSARSYAIVQNVSTTATCYIYFGDATSTNNAYILKGDSFVINKDNLYRGKITGICSPAVFLQTVEAY
jgi:hypothetical protein